MAEPQTETIVGVVLAGGRSRRMGGGDKSLRALGGRTMLAHVIVSLAPQVGHVIINANGDAARFEALGLPVVPDVAQDFSGPLAGILAGMRWAATNVRHINRIVTVTADAPFIPPNLVERLVTTSDAADGAIAVAQSAGVLHHATGLWPVALADLLASAINRGEREVGSWAARQGSVAVPFDDFRIDGQIVDPFFNVNTPDDFLEAARLMQLVCSSKRPA